MIRSPKAMELASRLESKKKNTTASVTEYFQMFKDLDEEIRAWTSSILLGECRSLTLKHKNNFVPCQLLPGHRWTSENAGPIQTDVMMINKLSYNDDIIAHASMMGESGVLFYEYLRSKGVDPSEWYVTNFVKTQHPEWDLQSTRLTAGMIAEFKPILQQEILLVQPKIILCLGTEALGAVLGQTVTMAAATNVVYRVPYAFPVFQEVGNEDEDSAFTPLENEIGEPVIDRREVVVIGIPHPHSVLRKGDSGSLDDLNANVDFFLQHLHSVLHGQGIIHPQEDNLDHRVIRSLGELEDLVAEIEDTCEDNLIAIDSEWNGKHPQNSNAYPRCFQLSWKHKTAAAIALAPQTEDCELARLCYYKGKEFDRLLDSTRRVLSGRRLAGHFIDASLEYLIPFGLDLRENFAVPTSWEEYRHAWKNHQPCGFDTGRAIHALSETADFSLKAQARERTEAGRYDKELDDWIAAHTVKKGEGGKDQRKMDGWGIIPDDLLYPCAAYDADVTRRLALLYGDMLDKDAFGNCCWRPFWLSMRALPAIVEINCTGLLFNWDRLEELTKQYTGKSEQLIQEIREWARWPEFNPRSPFQMRELLFGTRYNRKTLSKAEMKKLAPGEIPPEYVRIRPSGAKSMELKPLFTTGQYPRNWVEMVDSGRDHLATPSTNKHTLAQLLFFQHKREITDEQGNTRILNFKPVLEKLRNWNTVSQTLRYVLKPPVKDETDEPVYDDEGNLLYDKGIPSCVCDDNRVRTRIWPTKATGRWSSVQPSLQNLGKRVENTLKDIFQEEYQSPLRSLFQASTGHVFIEADYIGAEIASAAFMCNDATLLEHVRRNQLPEDHPDHYDIHSQIAVTTFKLDCKPSKHELERIGKAFTRDISKETIFGIFYGGSPRTSAERLRSQGVIVSEEEAQSVVQLLRENYPRLLPYFDQCAARAESHRWLANAFGRYRRFPAATDEEQLKRFERQAKNFPIQGLVADVVNHAVDHLYTLRNEWGLKSKLVLQIQDAIILEVPEPEIKIVYEQLLPEAMIRRVPIFSTDMNGHPLPNSIPRHLGIDIAIFKEWGKPIKDLSVFGMNIKP
jgi:uracil-DNA glycosylase family 4